MKIINGHAKFSKRERHALDVKMAVELIRQLYLSGQITEEAMRKIESLAKKEIENHSKT